MRFVFRLLALGLALAVPRLAAHPETAEARAELDRLIAEFPRESELYLRRAALRLAHAEWSEAEADLRRAETLTPDSPRVATQLGQLDLGRGQLTAASRHFDAALARAPGDAEALILRARTRALLGDIPGAHADYSAALRQLEAPSPDLFLARAALPIAPALALRGLDEGIAQLGPAGPLLERALALELRLGRTDAALARLDVLTASSGRQELWLKRRGDILAAAGRSTAAREAYVAALVAVAALPPWLRDSPETAHLATELARLAATSS
ncbi:MAG: tetratricopeptide repeat protein [Opitutus sp.]|nr:tetratricopeptide repeat protein [Opitutus sp.]